MFGKYYDKRASPIFVKTYSRVPNLDTEIFNISVQGLKQSRRTTNRTQKANKSIERTREKSERLSQSLKNSRLRVEQDDRKFIDNLKQTQRSCIDKERITWRNFDSQKKQSRIDYVKNQKYLDDLLSTNASKASSRLISVRRWH